MPTLLNTVKLILTALLGLAWVKAIASLSRIIALHPLVGETVLVEAPTYEGVCEVLSINRDDTAHVQDAWSGAIYLVHLDDLSELVEEE